MRSRSSALVVLVASVALIVAAIGAWATGRDAGVGTDLEQVTALDATTGGSTGTSTGGSERRTPTATPTPAAEPVVPDVPVVDASRIVIPAPAPPPRQVSIPSVGVTLPVAATGVQADGQMELPEDPRVVGWYRFGARPGDPRGSAVLGGHVDSERYGVGPLNRLASVQPGDRVAVTDADGSVLRYEVTRVQRIVRSALPTNRLFAEDVAHQLAIVTCGGRYLPEAGGYEDNIVVIAKPVGS
jgi:hypothetical protein